jgi:hypothetical protein
VSTKERPILFSAPMVRAILEGRKTQTRRVVKHQGDMEFDPADPHFGPYWLSYATDAEGEDARVRCPYGKPGDRLWVRETWAVQHEYDAFAPSEIGASARWRYAATEDLGGLRKRPSIFLPRRGSRITLEITDVRVERLQKISEADAIAEGVTPTMPIYGDCGGFEHQGGRDAFWRLWQSINGAGSWDANPWVWVVEFQRVEVRP